jgi:hypothetical protein
MNEAIARFNLVIPVELRRPFDIKIFLTVILSDILQFEDEELKMTCMALRLKFVDTILFLEKFGSSVELDFGDLPDIYLRDFVPLLASYYRLYLQWKDHDTTPQVIMYVNSLRVVQVWYNSTAASENTEGFHEYKARVLKLRGEILLLLPRVRGGYHTLPPEVLADLCMYMHEDMDLLMHRSEA